MAKFTPYSNGSKITLAKFVPGESNSIVLGNKTDIGVWDSTTKTCTYKIRCHKDTVSDVSFHPLNKYALLGSLDGTWSFHDLTAGKVLG